jgi:aconitase A
MHVSSNIIDIHPHMVSCAQLADAIKENGWPSQLTASLIGSCTNSSYEDMTRSASIAKQALEAGIKAKVRRRSSLFM